MNIIVSPRRVTVRPVRLALLAGFVAAALTPLAAAENAGAVGTVIGRVFHPARGEYVASAEVRIAGLPILAVTEQDGSYRLTQVPAGPRELSVTYTGMKAVTVVIDVRAGETLIRDMDLTAAASGAAGEIQRLDALVVRSEREGNAKAIMEQRRSMNLTNSLSSDFFGDVAEGSVGEFLKNVPGVDVDYVGPDARGPRLRGLDPQYVGVSVDGMKLASADGSQGSDAVNEPNGVRLWNEPNGVRLWGLGLTSGYGWRRLRPRWRANSGSKRRTGSTMC